MKKNTFKDILTRIVDFVLIDILSLFIFIYHKFFFFRIRKAIGKAITFKIKNKGKDLRIHGLNHIKNVEKLKVGNYERKGYNRYFHSGGGIEIEDNVQISRNVVIYSANHKYESSLVPYDISLKKKAVQIGQSSWIGMNVCILPGVKIGKGCIVGMGAIVTKDLDDGSIVVGQSAKKIKMRDMNHFDLLNTQKMWFGKYFPNS